MASAHYSNHEQHLLNLLRDDCLVFKQNGELQPSSLWQTASKALFDCGFARRLRRNDGPAFHIKRLLSGATLGKDSGIGMLTLNVLRLCGSPQPKEIDIAEESQLIDDAYRKLDLTGYSLTGHPLNPLGFAGSLEGDLANVFVQWVHDGLESKRFKKCFSVRKHESQNQVAETTRMINRISKAIPAVCAFRLELSYTQECDHRTNLAATAKDLAGFLEQIDRDPTLSVVGYLWWREFLEECGYRFHAVILSDGREMVNPEQFVKRCSTIWSEQLDGAGITLNAAYLAGSHRSLGIGYLAHTQVKFALHESLGWMNKRQMLFRITPHKRFSHCDAKALVDLDATDDRATVTSERTSPPFIGSQVSSLAMI